MSEQFEYKTNGKGILAKYRKKVDKSCKTKEKEVCNSSFSFFDNIYSGRVFCRILRYSDGDNPRAFLKMRLKYNGLS